MEGYQSEDRWVDLSGLPKWGSKGRVNWEQTVGYNVPFKCNEVQGEINILGFRRAERSQGFLTITIDNYIPEPIEVQYSCIQQGRMYYFVSNRIVNKAPELIKYLADPKDAYLYAYQSNKKINIKCPICGHLDEISVGNLYRRGYACPECSDGISIPNKIMFNVLKQLRIPFSREVGSKYFAWMRNYRYDFYVNINDQDILIEMDGAFHKLEDYKKRDKIKTELAIQNDFKLIRIDSDYIGDPLSYIQSNILSSELSTIFDLSVIDWEECRKYTITSLIAKECELWNKGLSFGEIMRELDLDKSTVREHLKRGKKLGLCLTYSNKESRIRAGQSMSKYVAFIDDNKIKYVFRNTLEVEKKSIALFGDRLSEKAVGDVCRGRLTTYHGLYFKYISKDEYDFYNNKIDADVTFIDLAESKKPYHYFTATDVDGSVYAFKSVLECEEMSEKLFGKKCFNTHIHCALNGKMPTYHNKIFTNTTKEEYLRYKMIEQEKTNNFKGGVENHD